MYHTYKISEIKLDDIQYSKIKDNKRKKYVYISFNDNKNKRLIFQTPELYNICDIIKKEDYCELWIPLAGPNFKKTKSFIDFLNKLDDKLLNDGEKYKDEWFGDVDDKIYKGTIRQTIYKEPIFENGIIKIKVVLNSHKPIITINNKQKIEPYEIKNNNYIKLILECYGIWITKKNNTIIYGLFFKPLLIDLKTEITKTVEFRDSDDELSVPDTEIETIPIKQNKEELKPIQETEVVQESKIVQESEIVQETGIVQKAEVVQKADIVKESGVVNIHDELSDEIDMLSVQYQYTTVQQ